MAGSRQQIEDKKIEAVFATIEAPAVKTTIKATSAQVGPYFLQPDK